MEFRVESSLRTDQVYRRVGRTGVVSKKLGNRTTKRLTGIVTVCGVIYQ